MSRNPYLSALTSVIDTNKEIIIILKFMCSDTEGSLNSQPGHESVRKLGTACGFMFAASTLGIVCVPPTGGLSLLFPALAAATATGLITAAIACGGAGQDASQQHEKKIKTLQKKHAFAVEKLNVQIERIRQIVDLLKKRGYSAEMATVSTLACMAQDLFDTRLTGIEHTQAAATVVDVSIKSNQVTKLLANAGVAVTNNDNGGGYSVVFTAVEELEGEAASCAQVGVLDTLKKQPEILGIGAQKEEDEVEGVAFNQADCDALCKIWNKPEGLAEAVGEIIGKLELDIEERQDTKLLVLALSTSSVELEPETPAQAQVESTAEATE